MIAYIRKHQFLLAILISVLYQIACAVQGFDLSDEGWAMYFYQQIFKNPEVVGAQMPYWFTGIMGGCWYQLFPTGGYLFMRILGIVIVTITFSVSYKLLAPYFNKTLLLLGLVSQVIIVAGDPKPFGYNSLSAFFVVISIALLFKGMEKRNLLYLFLSGFLLGINVFVRMPNIASLVVIFLIPAYSYLKKGKVPIFTKYFLSCIAGVILSITLVIIVMNLLGHWNLFLNSFTNTMNSASDKTNSHQIGAMFTQYLNNYGGILKVGLFLSIIGAVYCFISGKLNRKLYSQVLILLIFVVLAYFSIHENEALRDNDMFFIHFISYLSIALILLNMRNENFYVKFFSLASLLMIVFIPLGSDRGIVTIWVSSWLSLPLGTAYLYMCIRKIDIRACGKFKCFDSKNVLNYFFIVYAAYIITGVYKDESLAYYDLGNRMEKIYPIENQYSRFIYTNEYRSRIVNQLLEKLSLYVKPNDYLIAYNFIPGINYMTDTRSFVPNSWIWCYSGEQFERIK